MLFDELILLQVLWGKGGGLFCVKLGSGLLRVSVLKWDSLVGVTLTIRA